MMYRQMPPPPHPQQPTPPPPLQLLFLGSFVWPALVAPAGAIRPKFSWDYVGNMTFVHLCNESGLFNDNALDTIVKFPLVTVEKGQGFNDGTGVGHSLVLAACQLPAAQLPGQRNCPIEPIANVLGPPTRATF